MFEYYSNISIVVKVFSWGNILYNAFKCVSQGSGDKNLLGKKQWVQRPQGGSKCGMFEEQLEV